QNLVEKKNESGWVTCGRVRNRIGNDSNQAERAHTEKQRTGTASRAVPPDRQRRGANPPPDHRGATKCVAAVIHYLSRLLAHGPLPQFWTACSEEWHGGRGTTHLCVICLLRHLFGP